jgi:hypothetical protein
MDAKRAENDRLRELRKLKHNKARVQGELADAASPLRADIALGFGVLEVPSCDSRYPFHPWTNGEQSSIPLERGGAIECATRHTSNVQLSPLQRRSATAVSAEE